MYHHIYLNIRQNFAYFGLNVGTVLLLALVVGLYVLRRHKNKKLPPGPMGLPIFGYYFFLGKKPEKTIDNLAKKYGNVFGLYLGPQYVVFLNDWDSLKDAFSQNATINRPQTFQRVPFNFGIGGANDEEWVQARRLSSKAMKDVGMHDNVWEQVVEEEVAELVQEITRAGDRPLNVRNYMRCSFTNTLITLIVGKKNHSGRPFTELVSELVDTMVEYMSTLGMLNFSITLTKVLKKLGVEKENPLFEKLFQFCDLISNTVDQTILKAESEKDDSFVLRFKQQIDIHRKSKEEKTLLSEDTIKGTVISLLAGGSETSRSTVIYALIAMAENHDIQSKVHEEIDRVFGKESSIRWSERSKLPYTHAALMESMRWSTLIPFTSMRMVSEDMEIQGYHIPKGTCLTVNNYSMHNDTRYWKNPERFIPERFFLEDGEKVNTAPDSFNPFSYGKRICPGKLIAQMETFQSFTTLMQNFKIKPREGNKVKYSPKLGLTYQVTDAELRFIPR